MKKTIKPNNLLYRDLKRRNTLRRNKRLQLITKYERAVCIDVLLKYNSPRDRDPKVVRPNKPKKDGEKT